MNNNAKFTDIVRYLDRFHKDVGQLLVSFDRSLDERGFESLPDAGNSAARGLTSHYRKPDRWRMRYIYRFYVQSDLKIHKKSLVFVIYMGKSSKFDFPPLLAGIVSHLPLTESQLHSKIYSYRTFRSIIKGDSSWSGYSEDGWSIAKHESSKTVEQVKGFILNVFDLKNRDLVMDNIIRPLTEANIPYDPKKGLIRYLFPVIDFEAEKV